MWRYLEVINLDLSLINYKIKPKDKRKYTFMMVSHRGDNAHSFSVSVKALQIFGATVLSVFLIAGSVIAYETYSAKKVANKAVAEHQELETLRANKDSQEDKINQLAVAANDLQKQLENIDRLETEVKRALGSGQSVGVSRSGVEREGRANIELNGRGGPGEATVENLILQVKNLQDEVVRKKASLSELKLNLDERNAKIESTPNIHPSPGAEMTSRFGGRSSPMGIGSTNHQGVDLANAYGAPIYATAAGTVVQSGWNGGYGRYIEIEHGYGFTTAYAHNSANYVSVGQRVEKGQQIGAVGNSGYSTGPHVHYEVKINGNVVNPERFL